MKPTVNFFSKSYLRLVYFCQHKESSLCLFFSFLLVFIPFSSPNFFIRNIYKSLFFRFDSLSFIDKEASVSSANPSGMTQPFPSKRKSVQLMFGHHVTTLRHAVQIQFNAARSVLSSLAFPGSRTINGALFWEIPYLCHLHKETESWRHITSRHGVTVVETNHLMLVRGKVSV